MDRQSRGRFGRSLSRQKRGQDGEAGLDGDAKIMTAPALESSVAALLASGKGILAADESFPTIEKRFKALHISSTEENRCGYRELLFTTPELNEFISGTILFDETIRQKTRDGIPFSEFLAKQGIVAGIKADNGTTALANFDGERITQGFAGLRRCDQRGAI